MCGRFTQRYTWSEVHAFLSVIGAAKNLRPRCTLAPCLLPHGRSGDPLCQRETTMQERRSFPRGRTYLGGQVAFNGRCSVFNCVVRNMSQNGARIAIESTATVPREFDLMVQQKGESRRARIIWRDDREIGVAFCDHDASKIFSIETARHIKKLEMDRDVLYKRVAQLTNAT